MKFIKTLFLSALALGTITFSSCTKDGDLPVIPEAAVTAKIDGTLTEFNTNMLATTNEAGGATVTNIQGTDAKGNKISIAITGALTAGQTYTSGGAADPNKPIILFLTASNESYLNDDNNAANVVSVTITAASSTNVQGTFKGNLATVASGGGAVKTKAVTEGKFNVALNTNK
ncbi:hypothetical protein [Mucilaginibacter sp.]|uniref:hypothetical protein n=1 Tax=Mucilaginibacter sp. TaxID=1882438 RepID=UPI00262334AD|nr:hypothetical protein [Mucilaginibacter sp.]MDB5129311.1 hypothetical protein [Mucilaginibacter sp.]